jgi:hypothetical protein
VPSISQYAQKPDVTIKLSMDAWAGYFVGDITLDALVTREDVKVSDKAAVTSFFSMFDQVHPSKAALIPASALQ